MSSDLTSEQKEFLEECEKEFGDRYTDGDSEFTQFKSAKKVPPPAVSPWNRGEPRHGGGRRGGDRREVMNPRDRDAGIRDRSPRRDKI